MDRPLVLMDASADACATPLLVATCFSRTVGGYSTCTGMMIEMSASVRDDTTSAPPSFK